MLTVEQIFRVAELMKSGMGASQICREMRFSSPQRAVLAMARVKRFPDLEWSMVSAHRRAMVSPLDPTRRPTLEELEAFLRRMSLPDGPTYGPNFTQWIVRFGRVNGLDALAKEIELRTTRMRQSAWIQKKAEKLRGSEAARHEVSSGGGG